MKPAKSKEPSIFQFKDGTPAFSICNLDGATHPGTCCNPICCEEDWEYGGGRLLYYCGCGGIHLHCHKHINVPLRKEVVGDDILMHEVLWCEKCKVEDPSYNGYDESGFDVEKHIMRARAFAASEQFKQLPVTRIDDQLVQIEFRKMRTPEGQSDYYSVWGNIETDKNGDPQINLYVALKSMKGEKTHYFIEPMLGELREEVRGLDIDPSEIISKIEITTRKCKIRKEYTPG